MGHMACVNCGGISIERNLFDVLAKTYSFSLRFML